MFNIPPYWSFVCSGVPTRHSWEGTCCWQLCHVGPRWHCHPWYIHRSSSSLRCQVRVCSCFWIRECLRYVLLLSWSLWHDSCLLLSVLQTVLSVHLHSTMAHWCWWYRGLVVLLTSNKFLFQPEEQQENVLLLGLCGLLPGSGHHHLHHACLQTCTGQSVMLSIIFIVHVFEFNCNA